MREPWGHAVQDQAGEPLEEGQHFCPGSMKVELAPPMMPCWSWSAASAAVGNCGAKVERGRKGGNSERNHEKCGAWKCLPRFLAARQGFQEKHIFKFNLRCLFFFFFSSLHPLPTVGKGLALEAVPRCLETATMLKKLSIMWLFWKCGDSSCKRGSAFSASEHVLYVCSCRSGLRKKKKLL